MEDTAKNVYKKVDSMVFGFLSPQMIRKMASAKVVTPELYDKEGYPVDGGLMDMRLGVLDPGLKCKTCGSKLKECMGHFGYTELARPIIHIKFIDNIRNALACTCRECSRILMPENKVKNAIELLDEIERIKGVDARRGKVKEIITSLKSIKKCPHCQAKQTIIQLSKPYSFIEDGRRISPIEIRSRLEKIPDEDTILFGLNPEFLRPEWMILTIFAIPPVTMRPSITLESGERSEDDLTHKLGDIVRINQRLFENINAGAPEIIIEDLWDLLQYHVTTFFDNNVSQLPPARHRSGQPLKTISERIASKEGRIRHNLMGKRTNFSARTVISPDPMIEIDEVGVPKLIAMKLTVPERVTEWNMEYLKKYIQKGADEYPGANYVVRPDGKKKKITEETKEQVLEELEPGYFVERHLLDGDIALFNRQPSLHRMSMMCHKVKVLPGRTFRINPAVCAPYNADFDGDEMNLHIPQTEEARAEAEELMEVQTQTISPRYGLSIIGCSQDAISGNYLLTGYLSFTRNEAIDILASIGMEEFNLPKKEMIKGSEIFSAILPKDFSFKGKDKSGEQVIIKNGKLTHGVMDKANLGEGSGLMLRNLHKKYGPKNTLAMMGKIFKLGNFVSLVYGFSVAISDVDIPSKAKEEIQKTLEEADKKVNELIEQFKKGKLESLPSRSNAETLELKILNILNKARNDTGTIVMTNVDKTTPTLVMAQSGARGNVINIAQMTACVGQQALRGMRIDRGYEDRTLSCFEKKDLRPSAHGFVKNSYKSGLTPHEFFFHAITGRDSLMDTALRTPKSGYLYRRLSSAMQDLKVEYDETVRDSGRKIVQFSYGEDGIDVSKSEGGKIDVKKIIDSVVGD